MRAFSAVAKLVKMTVHNCFKCFVNRVTFRSQNTNTFCVKMHLPGVIVHKNGHILKFIAARLQCESKK